MGHNTHVTRGWLELDESLGVDFIPVEHWVDAKGQLTRDPPSIPHTLSFPSKATAVSFSLDLPVASGQQHRQQ